MKLSTNIASHAGECYGTTVHLLITVYLGLPWKTHGDFETVPKAFIICPHSQKATMNAQQ